MQAQSLFARDSCINWKHGCRKVNYLGGLNILNLQLFRAGLASIKLKLHVCFPLDDAPTLH